MSSITVSQVLNNNAFQLSTTTFCCCAQVHTRMWQYIMVENRNMKSHGANCKSNIFNSIVSQVLNNAFQLSTTTFCCCAQVHTRMWQYIMVENRNMKSHGANCKSNIFNSIVSQVLNNAFQLSTTTFCCCAPAHTRTWQYIMVEN